MTVAVAGKTWQKEITLKSQSNAHSFQVAPTIVAGDFKRSIVTSDGTVGALANLDNLPTVDPTGSVQVKLTLTVSETTAAGDGGHINIVGIDASDNEWDSVFLSVDVEADAVGFANYQRCRK